MYIYIYIIYYIEKDAEIEAEPETEKQRERESINKTNREEQWFDFHIRNRGESMAMGLPSFSKN